MEKARFSPDWLQKFSDPYAILGLSVTADDRRVLQRYRTVAKILHPDRYAATDQEGKELASQIFARLVNPAYQKLKQERDRTESLAALRFQVRRLKREGVIKPQSEQARQLSQLTLKEAEVFYEQAVSGLAEVQYQPLHQFAPIVQQLTELNLVYLQLKMDDVLLREKRTGLVSTTTTPIETTPIAEAQETLVIDYGLRHFERAQEYLKKDNAVLAVQELRDAIKLNATKSEYHALLGLAYFKQSMVGMATAHFRQALKLNPKEPLALHYAAKLNIKVAIDNKVQPTKRARGGLFGLFGAKQR